jgi:hypothetical protein
MFSIGVDHHSRTSHLTICDQDGSVILSKGIPGSREELIKVLIDVNQNSHWRQLEFPFLLS